jgi:hypothetical protein
MSNCMEIYKHIFAASCCECTYSETLIILRSHVKRNSEWHDIAYQLGISCTFEV